MTTEQLPEVDAKARQRASTALAHLRDENQRTFSSAQRTRFQLAFETAVSAISVPAKAQDAQQQLETTALELIGEWLERPTSKIQGDEAKAVRAAVPEIVNKLLH